MRPKILLDGGVRSSLILGTAIAAICLALQMLPSAIADRLGQPVTMTKIAPGMWESATLTIPAGSYYLSLGRPRGLCDLSVNNTIVDSTRSATTDLRGQLTLGAPMRVIDGQSTLRISARCDVERGFGPSLGYSPVILSPRSGMALQLWRAGSELFVGPVACLVLLVMLLALESSARQATRRSISWPHLTFAVTGLAYSLSLSHYSRLFIDGFSASVVHAVLRFAFSAAFVALIGSYSRTRWRLIAAHGGAILAVIVAGLYFADRFESIYDTLYWLILAATVVVAWDVLRHPSESEAIPLIQPVAVATAMLYATDVVKIYINMGSFSAPWLMAVLAITTILVRNRDFERDRRVRDLSATIARTIESAAPPRETLVKIADLLHESLGFPRITAYIDAHAAGEHDRSGEIFQRVMERGYTKDTTRDARVDFRDGRGQQMARALQGGTINEGIGTTDNVWYLNVPMGSLACLNLSDTRPQPRSVVRTARDALDSAMPLFNVFATKLADQAARQSVALERLRDIRGDGSFVMEIGTVFADINGYSRLGDMHGEPFTRFIGSVYLPALCMAVRPWAVREFSKGDELYLVSIPDLVDSKESMARAAINTAKAVARFSRNQGANLCRSAGFPVVTFSVAANSGPATVVCDPFQVRTTGETVIHAARLREAAPTDGILLHKNLIPHLDDSERQYLGEPSPILVKKTVLTAHALRVREAA